MHPNVRKKWSEDSNEEQKLKNQITVTTVTVNIYL